MNFDLATIREKMKDIIEMDEPDRIELMEVYLRHPDRHPNKPLCADDELCFLLMRFREAVQGTTF